MSSETAHLLALNRGLMSELGLARVDLKRTALAAAEMTNWVPRVLGPMSLRPGLKYVGATFGDQVCRNLPFIYSGTSKALLELTPGVLRIRIDDELISRPLVGSTVANGNFNTDLASWVNADEAGATSVWALGYMSLTGTGENAAIRTQQVTVALDDQNTEHALRIVIHRGNVVLRVGSTSGEDDFISERTLRTGAHSLAFTPTGNFHIHLSNTQNSQSLVDSVSIETQGVMNLPTPYDTQHIPDLNFAQSADVMFIACKNLQQRRIERWGDRSWSVVLYQPDDGPFRTINTTKTTLTPSALEGDITLTASRALFRLEHVGALFRLSSTGQIANKSANGADQFTDPVLINGTGGQRRLAISISGTWSGTVTLQYSVAEPGAWIDHTTWTANVAKSYEDELDGQIIYYRLGIKAGEYTSGTAELSLSSESGTSTGVVRVTGYSTPTSVFARVIDALGGVTATDDWWEGAWSGRRGWPTAVAIYEGRLWWFGKSSVWGSESDAYEDFDDETEGDSGPISRTIGEGPVDSINWALPLGRLMVGTAAAELVVRSNSLDEPLTPTNFAIKPSSTQGSAAGVVAERIDTMGVFVQRSGKRLFLMGYDAAQSDYVNEDLTQLVPDLNAVGVTRIGVQRQPDTRIHCVRADGKVAMLVFDKVENVLAWCLIETDGVIEDVAVLPGSGEDDVYYVVRRTVQGITRRYVEKFAHIDDCVGGVLNHQADSYIVQSVLTPTTSVGGLAHLNGETVVIWADGKDLGTRVVAGGQVQLDTPVYQAVVGLPYEASYKSMKQGLTQVLDVPLNQRKRLDHLGLVLANTHKDGLLYGPDFDHLDALPLVEQGAVVAADHIWEAYDLDHVEFNGEWTTDARICLRAAAPRPCTVLAIQATLKSNPR
jgi:hypothetical protein